MRLQLRRVRKPASSKAQKRKLGASRASRCRLNPERPPISISRRLAPGRQN